MERELPAEPQAPDYETALTDHDKLELRVWLRLLTCTTIIEREVRRRLRQTFDTTLPRFDILAQLDGAPAGLTMGELSRRLMVSNGNITGLVERLVGEGLVARGPAPGDRRALLVRLTRRGKHAFDTMVPTHHGWIEDLMAGLGRREMAELHKRLGELKSSLSRRGDNEGEKSHG